METQDFLKAVVTAPSGLFELCVRNGSWQQHWYEWPAQLEDICTHASQAEGDVYFSSYLFDSKRSLKQNVLPSRTVQQDLDDADPQTLPLVPTILVQTSPGRHQGFWVLNSTPESLEEHEHLSKKLAYSIPFCDHSGWPLGHKVRIPNTHNYKYTSPQDVLVVSQSGRLYSTLDLDALPDVPVNQPDEDAAFITYPPTVYPIGPHQLLESIKDNISSKVYAEYSSSTPTSDRSASLWALTTQAFKAGLTRDQVYWLALNSVNNKFLSLRHSNNQELAKDVLRAEAAVSNVAINIKDAISEIRKQSKTLISERRDAIYTLVRAALKSEGEFIRTVDSRSYYIQRDVGRPIDIEEYNPYLRAILDIKYGLNRTETDCQFVIGALTSYCTLLPETVQVKSLSYYDRLTRQLYVHGGRRTIFMVTKDEISQTSNGSYNILFPWDQIVEPFSPDLSSDIDWGHVLFGDIPNVVNISQDEATTLLKVFLLYTIMRNAANSRPILALFGQPGSGKSTLARKMYAFIYGKHLDISGVTTQSNFDMATATLPFFVLDNMDTWERWIPDRLAQATGNTDVLVRKLYSNNNVIRLKRQAMMCVTAHDPKFGRADVADRLLILNLQRFSIAGYKFRDEADIINEVVYNRNKLWGSLLRDLQRVLSTPLPPETDLQLRIQDFARLGEWMAIALGEQEQFRGAIQHLRNTQHSFNMDEDHILVTALQKWLAKKNCNTQPMDQDTIFAEVSMYVPSEEHQTFTMLYKNSNSFIKRISTLQDTLSSIMSIDFTITKDGSKLWTFKCI